MPYQKPQAFMISLKVLLKNDRGEYLLLKTPSQTPGWFGKYDLPGGRINDDEVEIDFHELIDREIKEEAGPKIKYKLRKDPVALAKYRFKDGRCILYILFEARYISGQIVISDEHTEYRWEKVTLKNSDKYFHPKFVELFGNYINWNKNITFKL
jgi:ADP-ribose pyrophosphatase YjhB (NUDIX family)